MTRILVQRGSGGSSSSNPSQSRSSVAGSSSASASAAGAQLLVPSSEPLNSQPSVVPEEEQHDYESINEGLSYQDGADMPNNSEIDEATKELAAFEFGCVEENYDGRQVGVDLYGNASTIGVSGVELGEIDVGEKPIVEEDNKEAHCEKLSSVQAGLAQKVVSGCSCPPPPPVPPPKPGITGLSPRRIVSGGSSVQRSGSSRRQQYSWNSVASRSSPTGSRPSSPRSYGDGEGYNSADEQSPCFGSYDDAERERQFESDIRRAQSFEVRRMAADGNCLFRAVADQVYGDAELYDLTRQMCIDYMEKERDHFSPFVTESFTAYCKRKRRDKALLAEGRFYSDLELTEKEIERTVMEASRAEYLRTIDHHGCKESSTSGAEPSSSGARTSRNEHGTQLGGSQLGGFQVNPDTGVTSSVQTVLSMGFSYARVMEAYSIFHDDIDSIVCYLLETGSGSPGGENIYRMKGKAAE
ncbi:hypothetical protein KI387_019201 [Taxus chinensis]|uniref:ubiquitinyl hydrolase 1 n=1 Tax=Taxus chinensis TaxID=29808 RepID=A0AA38G7Q4_TAXCH|nr:hypothetical protein KI387_019201 [Taxus chinensis]